MHDVPLNPPAGIISRDMPNFLVVISKKLEIQSVKLTDRHPLADVVDKEKLNADPTIETRYSTIGIIDVYCYARNREEACKDGICRM